MKTLTGQQIRQYRQAAGLSRPALIRLLDRMDDPAGPRFTGWTVASITSLEKSNEELSELASAEFFRAFAAAPDGADARRRELAAKAAYYHGDYHDDYDAPAKRSVEQELVEHMLAEAIKPVISHLTEALDAIDQLPGSALDNVYLDAARNLTQQVKDAVRAYAADYVTK